MVQAYMRGYEWDRAPKVDPAVQSVAELRVPLKGRPPCPPHARMSARFYMFFAHNAMASRGGGVYIGVAKGHYLK